MSVVTRQQLHRYMSEPKWSAAQEQTADLILAEVESDLEARLYGAHITPVERTETAPIATDDGLVATLLPVFRVLALDGVTLVADPDEPADTDVPLPDGYVLAGHRLRYSNPAVLAPLSAAVAVGWPWVQPGMDRYYGAAVPIRYMAGWGPEPSLVGAILRKAQARMGNRHSDTMGVSGVTAQKPPNEGTSELFTDADIASLGRYRNLGWGTRR